jgi:oxygen-independent coproporphyrinogen III oxidase
MNSMTTRLDPDAAVALPTALLCRFDSPPMRYACYPTADRFTEAFGADEATLALAEHGLKRGFDGQRPLSVDIRLPLDRPRTASARARRHVRTARQLAALEDEILLTTAAMGRRQRVSELRLSGACVGALSESALENLLGSLHDAFAFTDDVELSIEVDPATTGTVRLSKLRVLGFGQVTFDLREPRVDAHRAPLSDLVRAARELGYGGVTTRVGYGFPLLLEGESPQDMSAIAATRPDRILLEAAAAVQCRGDAPFSLVPPMSLARAQRAFARASAMEVLLAEGYVHVGMDQFTIPTDRIAIARRQGRCHVDLDGVCEHGDGDVLGLGVSAMSRVGRSYYRNWSKPAAYRDALRQGWLPVEAGASLSRDDLLRRTLIHALLGSGRVDFESLELAHLVCVRRHFATELESMRKLVRAGLVRMDVDGIELTQSGNYVASAVATAFDRHRRKTLAARALL